MHATTQSPSAKRSPSPRAAALITCGRSKFAPTTMPIVRRPTGFLDEGDGGPSGAVGAPSSAPVSPGGIRDPRSSAHAVRRRKPASPPAAGPSAPPPTASLLANGGSGGAAAPATVGGTAGSPGGPPALGWLRVVVRLRPPLDGEEAAGPGLLHVDEARAEIHIGSRGGRDHCDAGGGASAGVARFYAHAVRGALAGPCPSSHSRRQKGRAGTSGRRGAPQLAGAARAPPGRRPRRPRVAHS